MTNETTTLDDCNITPKPADVLCGRGAAVNKHPGNVVFREIVKCNKALFHACPKEEKYYVAESIMVALQSQEPPVNFLEQKNTEEGMIWTSISKEKTIRKVFQALRERPSSAQQGYAEKPLDTDSSKRKKRKRDQDNTLSDDEDNHLEEWNRMMRHLLPRSTPLEETIPTPQTEEDNGNKRRRVEKCAKPQEEKTYYALSPVEEVTSSDAKPLLQSDQIKPKKPLVSILKNKSESRDKHSCPETEAANHTELDDFQDKIAQSINVIDDMMSGDLYFDADIKIIDFENDDDDDYFPCSESSLFGNLDGCVLHDNDYTCDKTTKSLFDENESIKV